IWRLERKTESLGFSPRAIRARALRARRSLLRFFSLISRSSKILRTRSLQSGLLGFLHHDAFVRVAHTLALVGLRRTIPANLGRDLANLLLVGTANDDLGLGRRLDGHTVGHAEIDRVAEPELQIKLAALGLRTITNADKVQLLLETVGNALHHVVDECTHRTCHGGCSARRGLEGQHTFFVLHFHRRVKIHRQRALGALDLDFLALLAEFDALGQFDRITGNSGHVYYSVRPRCTALRRRALRVVRVSRSLRPWTYSRSQCQDHPGHAVDRGRRGKGGDPACSRDEAGR